MTRFNERLNRTPVSPGVYLMQNDAGEILYVGKASNLRTRLRSYFSRSPDISPKIKALVSSLTDFNFIVTESEQEALILECNLINCLLYTSPSPRDS